MKVVRQPGVWWPTSRNIVVQWKRSKVGLHIGPLGCLLRSATGKDAMTQHRWKREGTSARPNKEARGAAGASREPEFSQLSNERSTTSRRESPRRAGSGVESSGIVLGLGALFIFGGGSRQIATRSGRMVRRVNVPSIKPTPAGRGERGQRGRGPSWTKARSRPRARGGRRGSGRGIVEDGAWQR